jgi:hypothetical protein
MGQKQHTGSWIKTYVEGGENGIGKWPDVVRKHAAFEAEF